MCIRDRDKNKWSEAYQNTIINALKFYFEKIRHEPKAFWEIRPRKSFKLPGTLSKEEVTALISANTNLKHKSILSMIYACGLRISEVVPVSYTHLDVYKRQLQLMDGRTPRMVRDSRKRAPSAVVTNDTNDTCG